MNSTLETYITDLLKNGKNPDELLNDINKSVQKIYKEQLKKDELNTLVKTLKETIIKILYIYDEPELAKSMEKYLSIDEIITLLDETLHFATHPLEDYKTIQTPNGVNKEIDKIKAYIYNIE